MTCRYRLQNKDGGAPRQKDKAPDMGHGGPGKVPHHNHVVLPRSDGHHARVRHHQ